MSVKVPSLVAAVAAAMVAPACHQKAPVTPATVLKAPVLTTAAVSAITRTTALSGGDIASDGGAAVTARGVCWRADSLPTLADARTADGAGTGHFASNITGLNAGTTYRVRAYATNSVGTGYGASVHFATLQPDTTHVPCLVTTAVTNVTKTSASSGGSIVSDGGAPVLSRGVCWSAGGTPTTDGARTVDGAGAGSFASELTSLQADTWYDVRSYATNRVGTGYGNTVAFKTLLPDSGTVTDAEGHVYKTIRIGDRLWMAENLRATKYSNGDPIPNVTDNAAWAALDTPAYCWYQNNSEVYGTVYGALYNWYAVDSLSNGNRSICPVGWHIPAEAEWTALTSALGELDVAGGQMKEAGTTHWSPPNTGATNSSGFTALPGGFRGYTNGAFNQVRNFGHWWSRTSADAALAWGEGLFYLEAAADHSTSNKKLGFSIRCVKD